MTLSSPNARRRGIAFIVAGFALVVLGAVLLTGRIGSAPAAASGEIFLAPTDSPGADTFTPSMAEPAPPSTVAEAVTAPAPSASGLVRASAASPGLYGGVRDRPSCATERLVGALTADDARARPWAGVFGIDRSDIGAYVGTLTPVLTRVDSRVTDYGLAGGRAVARPSILQAGTAVLVDRSGTPRVRCASGNPLGEPQPVASTPRYQGPAWPAFRPTTVVVVGAAPQPIPAIILVDIRTGVPFARIPGSVVIIDIDRLAAGVVVAVAEPGGRVTISGSRWPPGTSLRLTFDDPAVLLATTAADGAGNFSVVTTVPLGARPGAHRVTISGGGFTLLTPVYVVPPTPRVLARSGP
ncbi:MAG: DUF6777 domain-containing protein [Acidimicrobiales bacterium]